MRVCILGGGLSGLAAAWFAEKAGHSVVVLEQEARFGGLVQGFEVGGNWLDRFYRHVFPGSDALLSLLEELNLAGDLAGYDSTTGVFAKDRCWPFNGPKDVLKFGAMSLMGRLRFGLGMTLGLRRDSFEALEDTPSPDWVRRRMGAQALDNLLGPMLRAKFGAQGDEVTAAWLFSRLRDRAESRKQGKREQLAYLKGSFQRMLDALVARLSADKVELRPSVTTRRLARGHKGFLLETSLGDFEADALIAALPGQQFAPLLSEELARELPAEQATPLDYAANLCTVLSLDRPLLDYYWLNIADDRLPFTGVIEHTNFISPAEYGGRHLVYLSHYLPRDDALFTAPDKQLLAQYWPALEHIRPGFCPDWVDRHWTFRWEWSQPLFPLGYSRAKPPFTTAVSGLYQLNMSQHYPESRQMNTCIALAQRLVAGLSD